MPRLFIAIEPPEDIKQELLMLSRPLSGARWQNKEQLHLTLRFIGDLDSSHLPELIEQLTEIKPVNMKLQIKGVDYFGSKNYPRIVYAQVTVIPELKQLYKQVNIALTNLNIPLDKQKYLPHITLARLNQTPYPAIAHFLQAEALFKLEPFTVESFHLYRSKLTSRGSQYQILHSFPS